MPKRFFLMTFPPAFLIVPANLLIHLFTKDFIHLLHLLCVVYAYPASDTEVHSECVSKWGRRGP